jgi:hypothetical protein
MADEPSPISEPEIVEPAPGAVPPSREPRHDPGVIEGEATEIHDGPPPAPLVAEPPSGEEPASPEPAAVPAADAPAPGIRPGPRWPSLPFVVAALGALFGAALALAAASLLEPRAGALDAAGRRLAALERGVEGQSAAAADFERRLAALETGAAGLAKTAAGDSAKVEAAAAEARAARADAAKALSAAGQPAAGPTTGGAPAAFDASAFEARLGALESEWTGLKAGAADLGSVKDRLDKLESALAAPKSEARVAAAEGAAKRGGAAAAILAISLNERLNAGAPFPGEWAALARLDADGGKMAALKPFADAGAPTVAALAAAFAKLAPSVAAAATPAAEGGAVDRLLDHIRKLVRVRKVGEIAGDDPQALASRVAASLARGDLAAALDAYRRLPDAARQASADWGKAAEARLAAAVAAQSLRADAVARLAAAEN